MVFFLYLTVSGIIWQILESIGQFKHAYINYYWTEEQTKNIEKSHLYQFRVWLDVRPFSISGRIPDIQLISNVRYLVIWPDNRYLAGYPAMARYPAGYKISDILSDIRYPVSGPNIFHCLCLLKFILSFCQSVRSAMCEDSLNSASVVFLERRAWRRFGEIYQP